MIITTEPLTVRLVPFRTVNESNTREHWAARAKRAKVERRAIFLWLRALLGRSHLVALPLTITLCRIAPRLLDEDSVPSACKHVTDGISDYLAGAYSQGQDRQPGLAWQYTQRRGKVREYGIEITFAPGEPLL